MKFKLKDEPKIKYSKGEKRIFLLLGDGKKSSTKLIGEHYKAVDEPYNARKIVVGLLASLAKKINYNKEPFRLLSSPRSGPHAIDFWLEKK